MKLVFIHGAPATGKLTVAKALLEEIPGRLFDNHVAIDFARAIFDFDAPGFGDLVHHADLLGLRAAAAHRVALLVMTYCYSHPDDLPEFEEFEEIWKEKGGEMLPVFLHCSATEAGRRVGNIDRIARRKIGSREGLTDFCNAYNFSPVPRSNCLSLDTSERPAQETAHNIIHHFALNRS